MDATAALSAIARRLHGLPGDPHRVTSALGVWLLLATVARGAGDDDAYEALDSALGMARHDAIAFADELLAAEHPAIRDAYSAWVRQDLCEGPLGAYLQGFPSRVATGPMPTQRAADDWVARETEGLLSRFPLDLSPDTYATVATVLATKVSWLEPFGTTTSTHLGDGPFAGAVERVLTAHTGEGHDAWLAGTAVGLVGVHVAHSVGLDVWSVIGDASVPAPDLVDVVHELVAAPPTRVAISGLPLGHGAAWTVSETTGFGSGDTVSRVFMPAWSASADLDLMGDPALGFGDAGVVLGRLARAPEVRIEARQSAMARYGRVGFEAAAATAMGVLAGAAMSAQRVRVATLRFAHPYAVVAVAQPPLADPLRTGPWDGLPVFSAWVTRVEEPQD